MPQNTEIDSLKTVSESLDSLEPEAQLRVLAWANAKYAGSNPPTFKPIHAAPGTPPAPPAPATSKAGRVKKPNATPRIDKELNLAPAGKVSFKAFIATKHPISLLEKCVVAVYYLGTTLALPQVSVDQVYTAFKAVEWRVPNDMVNTLQQAGSKGWLNSATKNDLKLTPTGENLVEHDLPRAATA